MTQLGVFLLPPRWDAGPSQVIPQHYWYWYPFIPRGGERHCESNVSCLKTQHGYRGFNNSRVAGRTTCLTQFACTLGQAFHFFAEQGPWNQPLHSRHLLVYLFVHDCPCTWSTFLVELGRCLMQLICHSKASWGFPLLTHQAMTS